MAVDLDEILQELGPLRRQQVVTYLLLGFCTLLFAMSNFSYVFTAGDLNYRCYIPECEERDTALYQPEWLHQAVPLEGESQTPSKCLRFQLGNHTFGPRSGNGSCAAGLFINKTVRCDKWIFEGEESTILKEWDLTCEENYWKLALVGTANSVGCMIGIPVIGYLSDRFGRKTLFLWTLAFKCIVGVSRSVANKYLTFVTLEFLTGASVAGILAVIYILAVELVGPDRRVLAGIAINTMDSGGVLVIGLVSWWLQEWRSILQVIYIPVFAFIPFLPNLHESVRWLLTKGRVQEAQAILLQTAESNGVVLSEGVVKKLEQAAVHEMAKEDAESLSTCEVIEQLLRSKVLLLRLLLCCFCWVTNTFVYYGLSINSVTLSGSKYLNFVLVTLVELPAIWISYFLMQRFGRRLSMGVNLLLSAGCCVAYIFTPEDLASVTFTLFVIGKFTISTSFSSLYVYTTELFPTELRNSLFGTCAMMGRAGVVAATQINTLALYFKSLPLILFGGMGAVAGLLSLLLPETKGVKMPDTVQDSVHFRKNVIENDKVCSSNITISTEVADAGT